MAHFMLSKLKAVPRRLLYAWQRSPRSLKTLLYRFSGCGVIITSIPKSVTHLVEQLIKQLGLSRPYKNRGLLQYYGWPHQADQRIQNSLDRVIQAVEDLHPGHYLLTHLVPEPALLDSIRECGHRVIFMYRDPRAVVVSHVNHVFRNETSKFHPFYKKVLGSKDKSLALAIRGAGSMSVDFPTYWLPDIKSYYASFAGWFDVDSCLGIRFEDLIGPQGGGESRTQRTATKRILDHIEYPYQREALDRWIEGIFDKDSPTFYRGKVDGWRDAFSERHERIFDEVSGNLLTEWGYK